MRVSQHSGRTGNAKHNDRSFLYGLTEEEQTEKAPHIDSTKGNNIYWSVKPGKPFREAELSFYRREYAAAIEATNQRYRAEGHADRCKTVEQVYAGKQTCPEEIILQIGTKDDSIDPETFKKCVASYITELDTWNHENGKHMHLLSMAIHFDESSPHVHLRRVWDYTDRDGLKRIGQNKALEAAGVTLPDPEKPQGRYNNRKITFDAMMREKWQKICRENGFEIETEPRPNMRHKSKAEYVAGQIAAEIEALEQRRDMTRQEYRAALDIARRIRDTPQRKPSVKGFGKNRREVIELSPDEYKQLQQAVNAITEEARRCRYQEERAREREGQARREKAQLENAIRHCCGSEQQARIFLYMADPGRETGKEDRRKGIENRSTGRDR